MYTVIVKCIIQFLLCFEVKLHQLSRPAIKMQMEHKRRQRKFLPLKIHASDWPLHTKVGWQLWTIKSSELGLIVAQNSSSWDGHAPNSPLEFNLLAVLPSSNFVDSLWTFLCSEEPEENLQLTPKEIIKNPLSTASGLLFSNKTNASNRLQLFRCVFKFEPLWRWNLS